MQAYFSLDVLHDVNFFFPLRGMNLDYVVTTTSYI